MEIWKPIEGYEGLYEVSNLGRVKSLDRIANNHGGKTLKKGGIMRLTLNHGYQQIRLSKNNTRKCYKVHRLVAQAFIPNPNNLPQINHKDENKQNNCVENLEWCTASYNVNYGNRTNKVISKTTNGKCSKMVLAFKEDRLIHIFPSMMEAERKGFNSANICKCCKGKLDLYKGFKWRYKEEGVV